MYKDSGLVFEYGYESNSSYSYLVLKLDSEVKLLNYQTEIISQNPNTAFVPFHIRREDDNTSIYYNITSKISLAQYLERKILSKKELLDLLKNITKNLMMHSNYLLDLSSFIIDGDFIYINPATAEVSLTYIPVPVNRDTIKVYSDFLKDLTVNSANIDNSAKDNYLQVILNYLKSDSFCLSDFNRLLLDLRDSGNSYNYERKAKNEGSIEEISISNEIISKEKAYEGTKKNTNPRSIMLTNLFIAAAAILCLFIIKKKTGDIISMAGVLIIAAALDILAMRMIMRNSLKEKEERRNAGSHDMIKRQYRRIQEEGYGKVSSSADVVKAHDTVLISEISSEDAPYFESIGEPPIQRIIINKGKFMIGRFANMADYVVQDRTVGKLHAEVSEREGRYFIKDLNSKNGTYVNDARIPSNKEWEIKSNDRIRFSNFEYVFKKK